MIYIQKTLKDGRHRIQFFSKENQLREILGQFSLSYERFSL